MPVSSRTRLAAAIVVAALGVAGVLLGVVGQASHDQDATDGLPSGYGSTKVAELVGQLPRNDSSVAVALFTADRGRSPRSRSASSPRSSAAPGSR